MILSYRRGGDGAAAENCKQRGRNVKLREAAVEFQIQ